MSTSEVVLDMVADASEFLDGEADRLTAVLDDIADLGRGQAPVPTTELAVLLAGRRRPRVPVRVPLPRLTVASRASRALVGLGAAAVAGLGVTGAAATANELPAPMQRFVAHLSEDYLPFSFPRPAGDPPAGADVGTQPADGSAATSDGGSPQGKVHPRPASGRGTVKTTPGPASARHHGTAGIHVGTRAERLGRHHGRRRRDHGRPARRARGSRKQRSQATPHLTPHPRKSSAPTHGKAPTTNAQPSNGPAPATGKPATGKPDTGTADNGNADGQSSTGRSSSDQGTTTAPGQSVEEPGSGSASRSAGQGGSGETGG